MSSHEWPTWTTALNFIDSDSLQLELKNLHRSTEHIIVVEARSFRFLYQSSWHIGWCRWYNVDFLFLRTKLLVWKKFISFLQLRIEWICTSTPHIHSSMYRLGLWLYVNFHHPGFSNVSNPDVNKIGVLCERFPDIVPRQFFLSFLK